MLDAILVAIGAVVLGLVGNLVWRLIAPRTETWTPAVIGVVAAAGIIAVGAIDHLNDRPRASSTQTDQPAPNDDSEVEPSTPTTDSTSPAPDVDQDEGTPSEGAIMATSLIDLPAVTQDTNDDIDLSSGGSITAGGMSYGQALIYECDTYCDGTSPQVLTVTLGGKFTSFTTQAVVLDTSEGVHRIDISLDSAKPRTFIVEPGVAQPIDLDVTGVGRMRIQLYAPGELKSPIEAGVDTTIGENGGGLPGVALGDPLLAP